MIPEEDNRVEFLIVDTSAFIKNVNLQDIGKNIITIPEVLNEIKSKRQIRRLVVLPYDVQLKEAFPESLHHVTEFSKKTGDYRSLSATDLKVIALTYQLEKELVGEEHLKSIPDVSRTIDICQGSVIPMDDLAGFYNPDKRKTKNSISENGSEGDADEDEVSQTKIADNPEERNPNKVENKLATELEKCSLNFANDSSKKRDIQGNDESFAEVTSDEQGKEDTQVALRCLSDSKVEEGKKHEEEAEKREGNTFEDQCNNISSDDGVDVIDVEKNDDVVVDNADNLDSVLVRVDEANGEESDYGSADEEEDDDDDDWITVDNIKEMKLMMDWDNVEVKAVRVACLTTDFAMQNVLKQIGLNVVSLDGKVIKQLRTFILRCYACFKTTSIMTKLFCPHCGNKTLKKVAVSLDQDGNQKIHIDMRKQQTPRGKKFSLPAPQGGKHANYPLLCEDQPMPDQKPTRLARMRNNPLEPDYIAGFSPFVMRDVNSKSAMLGIPGQGRQVKYWMRRNPNESHRRSKKKK